MKLIGNLKKQVELTGSKEEARSLIEEAGLELTDDELDKVAGGGFDHIELMSGGCRCSVCGCDIADSVYKANGPYCNAHKP